MRKIDWRKWLLVAAMMACDWKNWFLALVLFAWLVGSFWYAASIGPSSFELQEARQ